MTKYFGKYRGKVVSYRDPNNLGRLRVTVPEVLGENTKVWALPCVSFAGPKVGFFALPPVGANVWVEFAAGDPSDPIWAGCYWGENEIPYKPDEDGVKVFLKTKGIDLQLKDKKGGLFLDIKSPAVNQAIQLSMSAQGVKVKTGSSSLSIAAKGEELKVGGASISIAQAGVTVKSGAGGQIEAKGPKVSVNSGALEVI